MNTALILFGHVRTFAKTKQTFLDLFNIITPDVFIHTWDVYGFSTNGDDSRCYRPGLYSERFNIEPRWDTDIIDFSLLTDIPNIRRCVVETKDEVMPTIYERSLKYKDKRLHEHDHPGNIISCNRKIYLGTRLAINYSKEKNITYDRFIVMRFDLNFNKQIFIQPNSPELNIYSLYGPAAHISCFGTPEQVTKYADLYNQFDVLVERGVRFNPHELDSAYLSQFQTPFKMFDQMSIVR